MQVGDVIMGVVKTIGNISRTEADTQDNTNGYMENDRKKRPTDSKQEHPFREPVKKKSVAMDEMHAR